MKISGVYKITNTITKDFYIGSSKDVKRRWESHKWPSMWNKYPNNPMYLDMQKYGVDKFVFEILIEVEVDKLKETEQKFIEILKPTYNNRKANGWDIERYKEWQKEYEKSDKGKESHRKASRKYIQSNKGKESHRKASRKYEKSNKYKEYQKEYKNQLCLYNGETLTLNALRMRFKRKGIDHPTAEAKKYLLNK